MAEGYTIKLSQATFSKSIGNWLEGMTPAERHALLGAGIGGTTLAMRRLMSRRDKDHKKRGILSQALLGALLGGTAGYGLSSAFGALSGGDKAKDKTPTPDKADKTPGPPSVGSRAAEKVSPVVDAVGEVTGPVADFVTDTTGQVISNTGDFIRKTPGSGAVVGAGAGLGLTGLQRRSASKAVKANPKLGMSEFDKWLKTQTPETQLKVNNILNARDTYLRDTKMGPVQRFVHRNPQYADLAQKPVSGIGSIRRRVGNAEVNTLLGKEPGAQARKITRAKLQAYSALPWYKKLVSIKPRDKVPPAPAIPRKGRGKAKAPTSGVGRTAESASREAIRQDYGFRGSYNKPKIGPGIGRTVGNVGSLALLGHYIDKGVRPAVGGWLEKSEPLWPVWTPNK